MHNTPWDRYPKLWAKVPMARRLRSEWSGWVPEVFVSVFLAHLKKKKTFCWSKGMFFFVGRFFPKKCYRYSFFL